MREMTPAPETARGSPRGLRAGIIRRFVQVAFVLLVQAAILLLAAGERDWDWAWLYLVICLVSLSVNGTIMLRTSPETIAERGRPKETKEWDKIVAGLWALALFLGVPLMAGLDRRFAWTLDLSARWNVIGAVVLSTGLALFGWAMIANAYFSTAVRIQRDRGHTVCRTGPYRFLRHPGYAGAVLQSIGTPLTLGSTWALIPGVTAAGLMIVRTSLEDRMLQAELQGYPEYAQQVRYRLLPGVW
jgi:protein-S-isoprenylcysteine O-methyltransferase Ste14